MKKLLLFTILLLQCTLVSAQKNKADEYFKLYRYDQAIPLYEHYIASSPNDYEALKNLATAYQLTNDIAHSADAFKQLVALKEATADDLYQLVQMLQITGNIAEAKKFAAQYKTKAPGEKADNMVSALEQYDHFMATKNDFTVTDKSLNTKMSVYGVVKYDGQLLVTAENSQSNTSDWTGRGYTDIFAADNSFQNFTPFAKDLMTRLDDGTPSFTDGGNTMYYTSIHEAFLKEGNINTKKLKVAVAKKEGNSWKKADDFPYNSTQYKTAHPALSVDGSMLVFSSDMPGGKGGMDLYYCTRQGGSWSKPQNLYGLNTTGNELFPVFDKENNLLFSSNGLPGLGGLDLFVATNTAAGFGTPINLGAPLNSSYDDFCLFSEDGRNSGYLSTNRFGNPQIDHVAYFERAAKPAAPPVATLKTQGLTVRVLDKYTRTPLPYATVTIKDQSGQLFHQGLTGPDGQVVLEELPKGSYTILGMLNEVSTTIAKVTEADFAAGTGIVKEVLHNDPRFTLAGIAVNTKTKVPLEGVTVTCVNTAQGISKKVVTGKDGKFFFQLEQNSDFEVQGSKKGWLSSEVAEKTTKGLDRTTQLYVDLQLNIEQPTTQSVITLKKIHYSYDKCDIRPDAAAELNRLVRLMNDYPDMTIELSSHTDSRGSDAYNERLSQCRADSAVSYLIRQGIGIARMTAKGYGETRLLNDCVNGADCSDAKHEENRRTEFRILSCRSCPAVVETK